MKITKLIIFLFSIVFLNGCAAHSRYLEKRGDLDNNLYYYEQDTQGKQIPISGSQVDLVTREPVHVPQPAMVDMDSTIHILVNKAGLSTESASSLLNKKSEELVKQKNAVIDALSSLEKVIEARTKAVDAYQNNSDDFTQAKKEAAKTEKSFIALLREIWPKGTSEYNQLSSAYDDPTFGKVREFLKKQIESIKNSDRAVNEELKSRDVQLSLEAFLSSTGQQDQVAIHLDSYDSIKQGSLNKIDRSGLALSDADWSKLNEQMSLNEKMASTLEGLRKGNLTLKESWLEAKTVMSPKLKSAIDNMEKLAEQMKPETMAARAKETKDLFDNYVNVIKNKNLNLYQAQKSKLEKDKDDLLNTVKDNSTSYIQTLNICFQDAKSFKSDWENVAVPSGIISLLDDSQKTITAFNELQERLSDIKYTTINEKIKKIIETNLQNITGQEKSLISGSNEVKALEENINEYMKDAADVLKAISNFTGALDITKASPVEITASSPESFKVPISDIKNTFIDLNYTPRKQGDIITIKATLLEGDKEKDKTTATFQVERYGWYADLSPAVVLAKPTELKGGDDGFRFAPALSWLHHWLPRPDDSRWFANIFRIIEPSIGIHSAFTNFSSGSSSQNVQIGLGASLAFWKNRLQFGAGYNFMAKSRDEGRNYYFVGSDLIGILQTIGIVK